VRNLPYIQEQQRQDVIYHIVLDSDIDLASIQNKLNTLNDLEEFQIEVQCLDSTQNTLCASLCFPKALGKAREELDNLDKGIKQSRVRNNIRLALLMKIQALEDALFFNVEGRALKLVKKNVPFEIMSSMGQEIMLHYLSIWVRDFFWQLLEDKLTYQELYQRTEIRIGKSLYNLHNFEI